MRCFAFVLAFMLTSSISYAQETREKLPEPLRKLIHANSIKCQFDKGTQASWDGGTLKIEPSTFGEGGRIIFDSIDHMQKVARIAATVDGTLVLVIATHAGLTFVEQTTSGTLNFTTVFAAHDAAAPDRFTAVSSRHQHSNAAFPSQYHGTCEVVLGY